ncbi:hypothetical protein ACLBVR_30960, partial [Pseudomonas aeruginosa]
MQFEHLVQVNDRTLVDLPVLDPAEHRRPRPPALPGTRP